MKKILVDGVEYVSAHDLSKDLAVGYQTIYDKLSNNGTPFIFIGHSKLFQLDACDEIIKLYELKKKYKIKK